MNSPRSPSPESTSAGRGGSADARSDRPREEWSEPRPRRIPRPTAAPAAVALGCTLLAFGALTSPIYGVAGGLLAVGSMVQWVRELHDDSIE